MRLLLGLFASLLMFSVAKAQVFIKGNFKFPSDIAASDGKVYVVDGLKNRVAVYSEKDGRFLYNILVKYPYGIFVGEKNIYITVPSKGKVLILTKKGRIVKLFDVGGRPIDVVKFNGQLWVTDAKENCVKVFSTDGKLIKKIGQKGTAAGQFLVPMMITAGDGKVFVVDSMNARIQVFDKNGQLQDIWGDFGIDKGELFRPRGIAFFNGELAISDVINGAVQVFNEYGALDNVIAKGLQYPNAVTYDDGKIFVLEPLKNEILTFKAQGVKE